MAAADEEMRMFTVEDCIQIMSKKNHVFVHWRGQAHDIEIPRHRMGTVEFV
jgi:hypothetical protein